MDDFVDESVDTSPRRTHEPMVIYVYHMKVGIGHLVVDVGQQLVYTGRVARRPRMHDGFVDALRDCDSKGHSYRHEGKERHRDRGPLSTADSSRPNSWHPEQGCTLSSHAQAALVL